MKNNRLQPQNPDWWREPLAITSVVLSIVTMFAVNWLATYLVFNLLELPWYVYAIAASGLTYLISKGLGIQTRIVSPPPGHAVVVNSRLSEGGKVIMDFHYPLPDGNFAQPIPVSINRGQRVLTRWGVIGILESVVVSPDKKTEIVLAQDTPVELDLNLLSKDALSIRVKGVITWYPNVGLGGNFMQFKQEEISKLILERATKVLRDLFLTLDLKEAIKGMTIKDIHDQANMALSEMFGSRNRIDKFEADFGICIDEVIINEIMPDKAIMDAMIASAKFKIATATFDEGFKGEWTTGIDRTFAFMLYLEFMNENKNNNGGFAAFLPILLAKAAERNGRPATESQLPPKVEEKAADKSQDKTEKGMVAHGEGI